MADLFAELWEHRAPEAGPGGAPRLRRAQRCQVELRPASLDDQLAEQGIALFAPTHGVAQPGETPESPAVQAWRARMAGAQAKQRYKRRAAIIEWINAGYRNRGLYAVNIRSAAKLRAIALWHALAHNLGCIARCQRLQAA